jgi:hypothetical protein
MAAQENLRLDESGSDVLIDVTSLIGAEDFILSQNRRRASVDPFAQQCFAEVVQTIILMSRALFKNGVNRDGSLERSQSGSGGRACWATAFPDDIDEVSRHKPISSRKDRCATIVLQA